MLDPSLPCQRCHIVTHRYALRLLNDAGVFERLLPMNFITLGTPHLGSLLVS